MIITVWDLILMRTIKSEEEKKEKEEKGLGERQRVRKHVTK